MTQVASTGIGGGSASLASGRRLVEWPESGPVDAAAAWPSSRPTTGMGLPAAAGSQQPRAAPPSMPKPMRLSRRSFKKLPEQLALVQQHHSQASVELWIMDEHRIGLKPILRRVWAPKGAKVKAPVAQRYEWMYVLAGSRIHKADRRVGWCYPPSELRSSPSRLSAFAQEMGATNGKAGPLGQAWKISANKVVVQVRLKRPGMYCAPAHVNQMLALRTAAWHER